MNYTESVTIEWGDVKILEGGGQPELRSMWFMRKPPTFTLGGSFTPAQQLVLSNCLLSCTGTVDNVQVWRVDDASLNGKFTECVGQQLRWRDFWPPTPPDPWESGPQTEVPWDFEIQYEIPPEIPPPAVEIALLIEEVPSGEAWQIPIGVALTDLEVQSHAKLSTTAQRDVVQSGEWVKVFLVAPASLAAPGTEGPVVKELADISRFAVPVAFGLRALAEISAVFGTNRAFGVATRDALRAKLTPDSTNAFPTATFWFPEPDGTRAQLEVTAVEPGMHASDLVQVFHPDAQGAFASERVLLAVTNEWAIRIGPFRRTEPPQVRVGFVQGKEKKHPVADLETILSDRTNTLSRYLNGISTQEARLNRRLEEYAFKSTNYFWLPDLTNAAAKRSRAETLRALEAVRLTDGVELNFLTNQFVYVATYRPSPISLKAGASYNSEQGLGGTLEAGWSGLLRPGDAMSVKGSIAQHAVEGDLSYRLPYGRSLDRRTTLSLLVLGQAGKNDNYRLGSLSSNPFENQYQSAGIEHEIQHRGEDWEVTFHDALQWNAQDLTQPGIPGSISDAGLLFRHHENWRYLPVPRRGDAIAWECNLAPSIAYGPAAGWSRSFVMGDLAAGAKAGFGGANRDGMYASLRASCGAGTDGLPPALLYRLGDANRLLGLEPGEFSGNFYAHGEVAYGLNLSHYLLGRLFRHQQNTNAAPAAAPLQESAGIPPNLQGIYLKLFAEVGTISSAGGQPAQNQSEDVLSSFGAAIEKNVPSLGGAAFAIGYAWSPDNLVHPGGRFFTGLSWSF